MRPEWTSLLGDSATGLIWVGLNLLLGFALWRLSRSLFPEDTCAAHVLHTSLLYCAVITGMLTLIGSVHLFSAGMMLAIGGVITVSLLVLASRPAAIQASAPALFRATEVMSPGWVIAFCILVAHCAVDGLLKFPSDFDCLMYHLPMVDHWLQAGSLYDPEFGQWATPGGSELLAAWCCGPFTGDFLSPLNNLPVVLIWAAASLELCRLLGMERSWAGLATVSSLTVYTLLHETDDASNDLLVVAAFLACAVYGIRYAQAPRTSLLLMAGASLGLLYGVKYFALGYAAVAWGTFVVAMFTAQGWRPAVRSSLLMGLASLPFGGYWYARNLLITGLPLYPMGNAGELAYPDLWSTSLFGNQHPDLWPLFFEALWRQAGPVHWVAVILSPVTLCGVLWLSFVAERSSRLPRGNLPWMFVGSLLVGSAAILWLTPYLVEDQPDSLNHLKWAYTPLRYGLCFYSLGVLCGFAVIRAGCQFVPGWLASLVFLGLVTVEIWQIALRLMAHSREVSFGVSIILGLNLAVLYFSAGWMAPMLSQRWRFGGLLAISGLLSVGIGALSQHWHAGYASHFDRHLHTNSFSLLEADRYDGARICVLFMRPYPYFGSRREHHVLNPRRYVSAPWLDELARTKSFCFIAASASRRNKVYRFNGIDDYLERNRDRITRLSNSSDLRLALIQRDAAPFPAHPAGPMDSNPAPPGS